MNKTFYREIDVETQDKPWVYDLRWKYSHQHETESSETVLQ